MDGDKWSEEELMEILLSKNPELREQMKKSVERPPAAMNQQTIINIAVTGMVIANAAISLLRSKGIISEQEIDEMVSHVKENISARYNIGIE
jgi:hypothetical protein